MTGTPSRPSSARRSPGRARRTHTSPSAQIKVHTGRADTCSRSAQAAALADVAAAARDALRMTRPRYVVKLRIEYTRAALRYGWTEREDASGRAFFVHAPGRAEHRRALARTSTVSTDAGLRADDVGAARLRLRGRRRRAAPRARVPRVRQAPGARAGPRLTPLSGARRRRPGGRAPRVPLVAARRPASRRRRVAAARALARAARLLARRRGARGARRRAPRPARDRRDAPPRAHGRRPRAR